MGRAALITGGARRIGRAMALQLAHEGYDIALHYNQSEQEAEGLKEEINALGVACALFQLDLSEQGDVGALVRDAQGTFPHLNVLINNASVFKQSSLLENTREEFVRDFRIHLQSPLILIQAFAKSVKQGRIINIIDAAITKDSSEYFSYLLAKKSLKDLTEIAARELGPDIFVNAIAPGYILPPEGKEISSERLKNIPLRRQGSVDDVTQAMSFILNQDFITGQTVFVDGGEHLS